MKKIICIILCVVMCAALFCGCSKTVSVSAGKSDTPKSDTGKTGKTDSGSQSGIGSLFGGKQTNGKSGAMVSTEAEGLPMMYAADYDSFIEYPEDFNTEEYDAIDENGFISTLVMPLSTFSADVDTASYANLRRMIKDGYSLEDIPSGAVRIEEMVNYFKYDYPAPEDGEVFGVTAQIAPCPWNEDTLLLVLGMQTAAVEYESTPASNLVFLVDVSGSMNDPSKLPLLQQSFEVLLNGLDEKDTVSIVTYASGEKIIIEGVNASDKEEILEAINSLVASGSTNGQKGLQTAYEVAERHFIKGGNNRIIMASDGDLNVGITSTSELHDYVSEKAKTGVYLSVLGFGYGNYKDNKMETLADNGNGNYHYIDCLDEAEKVFSEDLTATMVTAADDVKFQIEFNPYYVSAYRQVGYENRELAAEDFEDDKKDAGEVGAGHSVTVLYELVPADSEADVPSVPELKFQDSQLTEFAKDSGIWMNVAVRYKNPGESQSILREYPVDASCVTDEPSDDWRFAAAVAQFGLIVKDSEYKGDATLDDLFGTVLDLTGGDKYREELAGLIEMLK